MENDTITSLQNLGLSEKEALVYNALLGMKKGTPLSVSLKAGIKRPTAYLILDSLVLKKLVAVTKFREVKDYRALPLEHLKNFVYKQKKLADVSLPTIQKLYSERENKLRLRIYHNISDIKTLLEKSLREKKQLCVFGQKSHFKHYLADYWSFYLKRSGQLNTLPKFKEYTGKVNLLLWGDKVAFVEFSETPQVFGFKNKELHDFYQNLWTNY